MTDEELTGANMTPEERMDRFLSPPGDAVIISSPVTELQQRVAAGEDCETVLTEIAQREIHRADEACESTLRAAASALPRRSTQPPTRT